MSTPPNSQMNLLVTAPTTPSQPPPIGPTTGTMPGAQNDVGSRSAGLVRVSSESSSGVLTSALPQDIHKKRLRHQLQHSAFTDFNLLRRFFRMPDGVIRAIIAALTVAKIGKYVSGKYVVGTHFPKKKTEQPHYKPFVELFNVISSTYHEWASLRRPRLPLHEYNRETKDGVDGAAHLKPDMISLLEGSVVPQVLPEDEKVSWSDIDVAVEVKKDWADLVAQAATYALALLQAHPYRTFVLVIGFNQGTKTARFMFFHRGGVHTPPEMDLETSDGLYHFIHGVIVTTELQSGSLSWILKPLTPVTVQLDSSIPSIVDNREFDFDVASCEWDKGKLTGRSTVGAVLEAPGLTISRVAQSTSPGSNPAPAPAPAPVATSARTTRSSTRTASQPAPIPIPLPTNPVSAPALSAVGTAQTAREIDMKKLRVPALRRAFKIWNKEPRFFLSVEAQRTTPAQVFAKCAWASPRSAYDLRMHAKMHGEFGAPDVWCYQVLDSNEFFYRDPSGVTDWHVFVTTPAGNVAAVRFFQERMDRVMIYFSSVGLALSTAQNPRELLEPILHAMLAHYTLYNEKKMLHRDISPNNLLRLPEGMARVPTCSPNDDRLRGLLKTIKECRGLLIDGDLARSINAPVTAGRKLSGTPAFISYRLAANALSKNPVNIQHTAVDDLESSLWVIVNEFYRNATDLGFELTPRQQKLYEATAEGDAARVVDYHDMFMTSPLDLLPQCPPVNEVFVVCMIMLEKVRRWPKISVGAIEQIYTIYFTSFLVLLSSDNSVLDLEWSELFSGFSIPKEEGPDNDERIDFGFASSAAAATTKLAQMFI